MVKQSRRNFIQTSLSTAILTTASVSGLASTTTLDASAASLAESSKTAGKQTSAEVSGSAVAYIRDIQKGEITLLAGEQEIVYTDHELVQRLAKAVS